MVNSIGSNLPLSCESFQARSRNPVEEELYESPKSIDKKLFLRRLFPRLLKNRDDMFGVKNLEDELPDVDYLNKLMVTPSSMSHAQINQQNIFAPDFYTGEEFIADVQDLSKSQNNESWYALPQRFSESIPDAFQSFSQDQQRESQFFCTAQHSLKWPCINSSDSGTPPLITVDSDSRYDNSDKMVGDSCHHLKSQFSSFCSFNARNSNKPVYTRFGFDQKKKNSHNFISNQCLSQAIPSGTKTLLHSYAAFSPNSPMARLTTPRKTLVQSSPSSCDTQDWLKKFPTLNLGSRNCWPFNFSGNYFIREEVESLYRKKPFERGHIMERAKLILKSAQGCMDSMTQFSLLDSEANQQTLVSLIEHLVETLYILVPIFTMRSLKRFSAHCNLGIELVHPEEFKNPSSFLKIYGDPQCENNKSVPGGYLEKFENGNWECPACKNVNYPRRFRCNNRRCKTVRDQKGDQIVAAYVREVYQLYQSFLKGDLGNAPWNQL